MRTIGYRLLTKTPLKRSSALAIQKMFAYSAYVLVLLFALKMVNIPLAAFAFLGGAIAIGVGFGAQNIINNFIKDRGRHPLLISLLSQLGAFKRRAFIMSWGFANKLILFRKNQVKLYHPITAWYYPKSSNSFLNSRTIIVDPYPSSIKTLSGRQFGLMRRFVGIFIYRNSTTAGESYTFFMGHAAKIRGFDLSIFNF